MSLVKNRKNYRNIMINWKRMKNKNSMREFTAKRIKNIFSKKQSYVYFFYYK